MYISIPAKFSVHNFWSDSQVLRVSINHMRTACIFFPAKPWQHGMDMSTTYPLVMTNVAIEHGHL